MLSIETAHEPSTWITASIVAGSEHHYSVDLHSDRPHGDEMHYLQFALHYYARIIYELARVRAVRNLPALLDQVAERGLPWNADVFAVAGLHGRVGTLHEPAVGDVHVTLRAVGPRELCLDGEVRMTGRPLAYSIFAVLQVLLPRVSPEMMTTILTALANMNASYGVTHRYNDPASQRQVPAIAFRAASFV